MENLIGNTWYYTLSTIAQVFATILGLYSVFVIFKVEKINGFIEELRSILINIIATVETDKNINSTPRKPELDEQTLIELSDNKLLARGIESIKKAVGISMSFKTNRVSYGKMENIPLTFKYELQRKEKVINSFIKNLFFLFFIILFTLLSLGVSELINYACLKNSILFLSIIFSVIASITLSVSILKIIKE